MYSLNSETEPFSDSEFGYSGKEFPISLCAIAR